jgi:hypothetical protein
MMTAAPAVLDTIRKVLASTVPRWQTLVETVPAELLERKPTPTEWSAAECLEHLLHTERAVFGVRLRHLMEGRPELVAYDPETASTDEPERTAVERVAAWRQEREEHLRILAEATDEDLQRTSHHPEYGPTTLAMILNTWTSHDLDHTIQAETALMQPFIPLSGHWQWEFAAKEIGADPSLRSG